MLGTLFAVALCVWECGSAGKETAPKGSGGRVTSGGLACCRHTDAWTLGRACGAAANQHSPAPAVCVVSVCVCVPCRGSSPAAGPPRPGAGKQLPIPCIRYPRDGKVFLSFPRPGVWSKRPAPLARHLISQVSTVQEVAPIGASPTPASGWKGSCISVHSVLTWIRRLTVPVAVVICLQTGGTSCPAATS